LRGELWLENYRRVSEARAFGSKFSDSFTAWVTLAAAHNPSRGPTPPIDWTKPPKVVQ
jgi:hypothetical protein